jgi:hypothetical protein
MDYASFAEAPKHMHFWTAVSTIAGCLRRKVWIDQAYFRWYPNFYIVLVAPPGIVSKSTTASIGMNLLKRVPGVKFGPDIVTMQALVTAFSEAAEMYDLNGEYIPMSPLTLESSEFGNLLNPHDKDMVDFLVSLWDGKEGKTEKKTKHSGDDTIVNPWINLIACTTPSWIAGNFPEYMIGGGFTSRCVFVYAEQKAKYVAYPGLEVPKNMAAQADRLVDDLCDIASITGEYRLSADAIRWGESWYRELYATRPLNLDDDRFGGYIARKQTHLHKLAIVLAASMGAERSITSEHLSLAHTMLTDLEPDMAMVFSKIGKSDASVYTDRLLDYVKKRGGAPYAEVYRFVHQYFPKNRDFEDVLAGCIKTGQLVMGKMKGIDYLWPRGLEKADVPDDVDGQGQPQPAL